MKRNYLYIFFLLSLIFCCHKPSSGQLQNGDIIFQTSRSSQSAAIQIATHSKYSHMGIIFIREEKPYVYEAARTVQFTPLQQWIDRGIRKQYVIKRLRNSDKVMTAQAIEKLIAVAEKLRGKPYDLTFEWSDDRIYCSELVWKIYDRGIGIQVGKIKKLRDFDLSKDVVKNKMKERYGDQIPLDETVISPGDMFSSKLLKTVSEE
jgi:Permuted papain-like amidase enzyme, YaeF/YiiX, C92 family